jgi:uncharacterized protein YukJ
MPALDAAEHASLPTAAGDAAAATAPEADHGRLRAPGPHAGAAARVRRPGRARDPAPAGRWTVGDGLVKYGVLIGRPAERRRESGADSPHYQIRMTTDAGASYRAAVNVLSAESPSELLYAIVDDLEHPITASVAGLASGWHELPARGGLDFVRGNLITRAQMRPLPPDVAGPDNDLADLLDLHIQHAMGRADARLYAFGAPWGPEAARDKIFGFKPGNGVHDIHMNQGNSARFAGDDGVWQDGGLLLHFPSESRWVGIFLAFQSQAWHTDDTTGHAIHDAPPPVDGDGPAVRILAAMVNPKGGTPEHETVLLLNASPQAVELGGWRVADRNNQACALPSVRLDAGAVLNVPLQPNVQLGNKGGSITLLDKAGLKVSGVAYTADQAKREGWTVTF